MARASISLLALLLFFPLWAESAAARDFRVTEVPNGSADGCLICHETEVGGPLNPLGLDIEGLYLDAPGAAGSVLWNPDLAALDSDGDGVSNGEMLLDPEGLWRVGDPDPEDASFASKSAGVTNRAVSPTDSDGDGLSNSVETNTGVFFDSTDTGTDPPHLRRIG